MTKKEEEDFEKAYISDKRRHFYSILSVFTLICVIVAGVTPFWLQSWPRIHTEVKRVGLWEFCLNGYVAKRDMTYQSYFGCWWIFAPYYDHIRDLLTPRNIVLRTFFVIIELVIAWFQTVQAFVTLTFIVQMIINVLLLFYVFGLIKNAERRALTSRIMFIGQILSSMFALVAIIVFGSRCFDIYWMPRPELNWPSWSYGVMIVGCLGSLVACIVLVFITREDKEILDSEQHDFPTRANTSVVRNKIKTTAPPPENASLI